MKKNFTVNCFKKTILLLIIVAFNLSADAQVKKVYEIGKWWYEHYKKLEAERKAVKLEANKRLDITPSTFYVSENTVNRLPEIEVTTLVAWVPFAGKTTTIWAKWYVNDKFVSQHQKSFTGVMSEKEWKWHKSTGVHPWLKTPPYPYTDEFTNSNNKLVFDFVTTGEGFDEGVNTVKVEIGGTTQIMRSWYDWEGWFTSSTTETHTFKTITKNLDVTVLTPFHIEKKPNLLKISDNHPANIEVELWITNKARKDLKGNALYYKKPYVTTVGSNGRIPPYDGSNKNEKMVKKDARTHTGPSHSEKVRLTPDFNPIKTRIEYRRWDIQKLRGTKYIRNRKLNSSKAFCEGNDVSMLLDTLYEDTSESYCAMTYPWNFKANAILFDENLNEYVKPQVNINVCLVKVSANGNDTIADFYTRDYGHAFYPNALWPGDTIKACFEYNDIFGNYYTASKEMFVPENTIIYEDGSPGGNTEELIKTIDIGAIKLEKVNSLEVKKEQHLVKINLVNLAGFAFNEYLSVAGINVKVSSEEGEVLFNGLSDDKGVVNVNVPHGNRIKIEINDKEERFEHMALPLTPAILVDQIEEKSLFIYLNSIFSAGPIEVLVNRMKKEKESKHYTLELFGVSNKTIDDFTSVSLFSANDKLIQAVETERWGGKMSKDRSLFRFDIALTEEHMWLQSELDNNPALKLKFFNSEDEEIGDKTIEIIKEVPGMSRTTYIIIIVVIFVGLILIRYRKKNS